MNMPGYLAYGLSILTDLDLDAYLCRVGDGHDALGCFEFSGIGEGMMPGNPTPLGSSHGRKLQLYTDLDMGLSVPHQHWCFEVSDVVRFHWIGGAGRISYERLSQGASKLVAFWLIHIFLPLYLTLEAVYDFIHACAVEVGGHTILLTGPSHGGKSTLTDFFLRNGHALVSDDKVATYVERGRYFAVPSHPSARPYRQLEDLGRRVENFVSEARPIDALYALWAVESGDPVDIEEVSGHRKVARLLPSYLFSFPFLKARRLSYLAQMVSAVPVFRVAIPWDLARLSEVYDAICEQQAGMGAS